MSKKRKTRKQKEQAQNRHFEQVEINLNQPSYSVSLEKIKKSSNESRTKKPDILIPSEKSYLKKDSISIMAASGIVIAFDLLLFSLLSSGVLKLNLLGY